jgi:hypothetical protein
MGLSFTITAVPRQRIHSRVRDPWDSRPYFTVSDSRLHFLSPPTTRRATVEVFYPASTWEGPTWGRRYIALGRTQQKTSPPTIPLLLLWADSVDVFTGRYQATHTRSRDCCMATVLYKLQYSTYYSYIINNVFLFSDADSECYM